MKTISIVTLVISALAFILGCFSLASNSLGNYPVFFLAILGIMLGVLYFRARFSNNVSKWGIVVFAILGIVSAVILKSLPEYIQTLNIHGVIQRSVFSAFFLLVVSIPGLSYSIFYLLGATPRANDLSRYPFILFPIILIFTAYLVIIIRIVSGGVPLLNWSILSLPFKSESWYSEVWQNGWPVWAQNIVEQAGMRNYILGTLLLMGLTSVISLPIGIAVGVFVHEYAGKILGGMIRFSTTALRAISGIILLITALNLTRIVSLDFPGTIINYIVNGFGYYPNGTLLVGRSSFLLASIFISLLVIPLIAQAAEQGLKSMPQDIFEGSLAVGASKEYSLTHILLPWSVPNIFTGLVLGCAEAAGSLTIIFLIAGTGQLGINPLSETTSLSYLIFDCRYGKEMGDGVVQTLMGTYQYAAALLLLIITICLTILALTLKKRISKRYKET
ncbi:MAG: ABC transporter permease subunit [Dehalococcoidales bacterium]